jgi:NAD(P)-dependent dehydrogenase (short-subunit alcohol dehydrogenase family)
VALAEPSQRILPRREIICFSSILFSDEGLENEIRERFSVEVKSLKVDLSNIENAVPVVEKAFRQNLVEGVVYLVRGPKKKAQWDIVTSDDWDEIFNPAVKAVYFILQKTISLMHGDLPSVVVMSSVNSEFVSGQTPMYHCAKAALDMLVKYFASLKTERKFRINSLQPGFILQDENFEVFYSPANQEYRKKVEYVLPKGAVGTSKDVSELVLFLLNPASKFMNGQIVRIDGGVTNREQFDLLLNYGRQS